MADSPYTIFTILACAMGLLAVGRPRYDVVALLALLAGIYTGVVPADRAFAGFGHPAVVTVAAVLVVSQAFQLSGVNDALMRLLSPRGKGPRRALAGLTGVTTICSAFMNNVGALALMLPTAMRHARITRRSPARLLMPLSFASLLGGLVTLIGTPPNIVIADYRAQVHGEPFAMFDFTPVGLPVALVGLAYLVILGWRLVPRRDGRAADLEHSYVHAYITEVRVPAESDLVGRRVRALEAACENELTVMTIIRDHRRFLAPDPGEVLHAGDLLVLQGDPLVVRPLTDAAKLEPMDASGLAREDLGSRDVVLVEAVVLPNSPLEGRSVRGTGIHARYGVNLLALAREGKAARARLGAMRFRVGDVLLLQGERSRIDELSATLRCLPLAGRHLAGPVRRRPRIPIAIFGAAVAAAAFGLVPTPVAFVTAAAVLLLVGAISLRDAYRSVDWPVVVLLGALLPLGEALQRTGGTDLIAGAVLSLVGTLPTWGLLAALLVTCMLLSDLVHNTPTAVLMAPVAVAIAHALSQPLDPFLMAVAVGSASPYLTPIGHQSNTLVMAPGGYRFGDYARVGLPLELLIVAVAVPLIVLVWM